MTWTEVERSKWLSEQTFKRSYEKEVISQVEALRRRLDVVQYGSIIVGVQTYPLYFLKSKTFTPQKKTVLITGGVHGYETSGVHGAFGFLEKEASRYEDRFNIVCFPCISPWAYETINRWNPKALDPNRSFYEGTPAEESRLFLEAVASNAFRPFVHFDLHETTDTDNTVFRPALEKRDGITIAFSEIPDGFYAVGDTENPQPAFQKAVIDAVRRVTHIAAPDANGCIIGEKIEQDGVINYPLEKLFLCAGISDAEYTTTTEVYPDSPRATPEICIEAQIAAITGGMDYLSALKSR